MKRLVISVLAATAVLLFVVAPAKTDAAINPQIGFQGKLTNTDGTNVTDGNYSIRFRIYTDPTADTGTCANTCKWEETQASVAVAGGIFNVNLGSVTTLPGSVDFNASALYLGIKVGSDAEMTPRVRLTAAPFAFNSDLLDGLDSSALVQLSPGSQQTGNINISGTVTSGLINSQTISSTANFTGTLTVQGASSLTLGTASSNRGAIIFKNAAGTNNVTLQAPATNPGSSISLTLPNALGSSGDCLTQSDGTGTLAFAACAATLQDAYDNSSSPATITTSAAAKGMQIVAGVVPTANLLTIDNTGQAVTTANANGLGINYVGGAAAVEAAGLRIDFVPGGTSGGTWSGMRIVANATGAVSGVTEYGLKLEGPTSPGSGTETAMYIGTGWDIGIDVQSGGLQLAAQSDPAAPASGNLRIYAKDIAGRILPKWIGPSGVDTPFQANLGFNRIAFSEANGTANCSTGATGFGSTSTGSGTCTAPVPASTNLKTSTRRLTFSTGTTAGTVAYQKQNVLQNWRGNAAGLGGFFFTTRFGINTLVAGNRAFVGMADSIVAPTNVDPTTNTTPGKIGMAINANTGNWNFVNNITGTAPTVTNLGASFPVNTTDLFELIMYCSQNCSSIGWRVTDLSTGAQTSGSVSSNMPASTTFLAPLFWITNNATAAAAILDFGGWYMESDN